MTYRERREARADRLREWADKRQTRAAAVFKAGEPFRSDWAFITQPGHIPFRAALIKREDRAHESLAKAASMDARADSIERAADRAIYSDDPDAVEALTARIADLEAKRDRYKAENDTYRKAHRAELAKLGPYERSISVPHASYEITNLTGNITRNRERLKVLSGPRVQRTIYARRDGKCADCAVPIKAGGLITEADESVWIHNSCAVERLRVTA